MFQEDLFGGRERVWQSILEDDGLCQYMPQATADHWQLLLELKSLVAWRQDHIFLFGKNHPLPRLQAWYGNENCYYSYSGIDLRPAPWNSVLLRLKAEVERLSGHHFNSVLLNYYRSERDHLGWHSDDEAVLGPDPVIASLSLGQGRRFELRHRTDQARPKVSLTLGSGDLLLMHGPLQRNWQHRIAPATGQKDERINLTFRKILHPTPIHALKP